MNETWNYTASHTVTQAEIDAGGTIDNTATVSGDDATGDSDGVTVTVDQGKSLNIVKTASVDGDTADVAGEVISYTMAVSNTGNAAIAGVDVDDPFTSDEAPVLSGGFNTGDTDTDGLLDVDETWNYTASILLGTYTGPRHYPGQELWRQPFSCMYSAAACLASSSYMVSLPLQTSQW